MMEELTIFFHRVGTYLWIRLWMYRLLSLLYRCFEKPREPLREYGDIGQLVGVVKAAKWRPDTWKQLWDTFSHPEHVQWLLNHEPKKLIGDCDDFACYEVEIVNRQLQGARFRNLVIFKAEILTVTWRLSGLSCGHNVCLLELLDPKGDSFYCYMDYGTPSLIRSSRQEVVADVLGRYAPGGRLLLWARSDGRTLKPIEVGWRL